MLRGIACGFLALCISLSLASETQAVDITGMKCLGGSAGTSLMIGDWQFRTNARPRLTGDAVFKWGWRTNWAIVGQFGFGWNAYASEESWLSNIELLAENEYERKVIEKTSVLSPFTVGIERRFGSGATVPFVGAGAGVYMQQLWFNRSVAHDPRNGARHRTFDFGFQVRAGIEQFLSDKVSLEYDALAHFVFSEDRERFPDPTSADLETFGRDFRTYGGDSQTIQVRMGVRYYWGSDEL